MKQQIDEQWYPSKVDSPDIRVEGNGQGIGDDAYVLGMVNIFALSQEGKAWVEGNVSLSEEPVFQDMWLKDQKFVCEYRYFEQILENMTEDGLNVYMKISVTRKERDMSKTPKSTMKWTQEIREYVFRRVLSEFGPKSTWNGCRPKGTNGAFKTLMKNLHVEIPKLFGVTPKSPVAIENQIDWGIQAKQGTIKGEGHHRNYILNRAAALEVGLIKSSDLPSNINVVT